jgi:aspartyl-tRNA(Asn)/glutamyl-tRNA(Gln) amidotransferase subunit A
MLAATRSAASAPRSSARILLGTYVLSSGYHEAWYGLAQKVRGPRRPRTSRRPSNAVDLVAGPRSRRPPSASGERVDDPLAMYLSDLYTVPANLAGCRPSACPPGTVEVRARCRSACSSVGPRGADAAVLRGAALQEATRHHLQRPRVASRTSRVSM